MAKLSGIFDNFADLDEISTSSILSKVKMKIDSHVVENVVGNLILYPQTVPVNKADMELDNAILEEALIKKPNLVWDSRNKKIIIQKEVLDRFPPLIKLVSAIIDALKLSEITFIALKDGAMLLTLGSFIPYSVISQAKGHKEGDPSIFINGVERKLKLGIVNILTLKEKEAKLIIGSGNEVVVLGGELGLLVDLRKV